MKKNTFAAMSAVLSLSAAVLLGGCVNAGGQTTQDAGNVNVSTTKTNDAVSEATKKTGTDNSTASTVSVEEGDLFSERDLTQTADLSEAKYLTVSDSETISISEAGVYVLSGSAKNACVVVEAGDDDKLQLVLDGLTITNDDLPCLLVENADKVFLTSAEGSENVTGKFGGDEDAVIFSRDDLVLQGLGTATVNSSSDGIRSNDDLKLTGGTWVVTASDTAMKAHDSILVYDGVYELAAGSDGLHAEDNDDDSTGSIVFLGGSFTIKAGDDGVHATTTVTVNGGTFSITAAEGIEATQVFVNDGTVSIKATDDGINAGRKSTVLSVKIEINGGDITIAMGSGDTDAIDSNGDLVITGGRIDITAQSPFDYDGNLTHTGGTIIVNGTETANISNQMMGGGMMGGQGGQQGGFSGQGGFGGKRR